jgi:hypothetical protein
MSIGLGTPCIIKILIYFIIKILRTWPSPLEFFSNFKSDWCIVTESYAISSMLVSFECRKAEEVKKLLANWFVSSCHTTHE